MFAKDSTQAKRLLASVIDIGIFDIIRTISNLKINNSESFLDILGGPQGSTLPHPGKVDILISQKSLSICLSLQKNKQVKIPKL